MATKKEIIADIKSTYGNFLTTTQVGEYLGLCPRSTRAFMAGVPRFQVGVKRCYLPVDIANRILQSEE